MISRSPFSLVEKGLSCSLSLSSTFISEFNFIMCLSQQVYGFVANRIKNAGKWTDDDDSKRKK